jgi:hypothetical protein
MDDSPQKVPGFRHPDGVHFIVWCDDCLTYHWHGIVVGEGHRLAHCCASTSHYKTKGYTLIDKGPAPAKMVRDADRKTPRGRPNY